MSKSESERERERERMSRTFTAASENPSKKWRLRWLTVEKTQAIHSGEGASKNLILPGLGKPRPLRADYLVSSSWGPYFRISDLHKLLFLFLDIPFFALLFSPVPLHLFFSFVFFKFFFCFFFSFFFFPPTFEAAPYWSVTFALFRV